MNSDNYENATTSLWACYYITMGMLPNDYRYATMELQVFYHCYRYSTTMLPPCYHCATGMLPLCYQYATTMLPVCYQYATTMLPVCYQYATGMLQVCYW
jgi:hypothetical protein